MNVLVTGAFQLNSGEREQLEAAGHIARSGRHISLPNRERMRRAFGLS